MKWCLVAKTQLTTSATYVETFGPDIYFPYASTGHIQAIYNKLHTDGDNSEAKF